MITPYNYVADKVKSMKEKYPALRTRADDYVFSALCVKANFYKNPALVLNETDFAEIIVDGQSDGGADILLSDPNSEESDLIIGQSKFYKTITAKIVLDALIKLASFYKDMKSGHYEQVNSRVQSRFITLNDKRSDAAKIHFAFYTSAPKNKIDKEQLKKKFREQFTDFSSMEIFILFAEDVAEEIKESESRKPTVEYGKLRIDEKNNYLQYGDAAAIVNVSAFSIKQLYAEHNINLLSRNLRYHIKGGKLDGEIKKTIKENPETFWLKNNGITIICDDFKIDGREVKLRNFSIVNGGQTTYLLNKSKTIDAKHDFYLSCKIIKATGNSESEKIKFNLEIATAANFQKAIKPSDLKANSPEQITFAQAMREVGIFYQTKRGDEVPKQYRAAYLHTKLDEVGKLYLAAIFQEPCKSRSNPSASYNDSKYYEPVFNGDQKQMARICKELLYIDDYFVKDFLPKFERDNKDSSETIPFARLARRICVAFVTLAARYHQGNITDNDFKTLTSAQSDEDKVSSYKTLRDLGEMKSLLPPSLYTNSYDEMLNKLFEAIIEEGATAYFYARDNNPTLTETNFLKSDKNYYDILKRRWLSLRREISKIFS